jgi:ABC-2 type transport system permease protein
VSSKVVLVAQREFLENARTKTFWIGIIMFPVILLLSIVVPRWLSKSKDLRKYAVLDHSGFLLKAVEERADLPDLAKLFKEVKTRQEKGRDLTDLPVPPRFAEQLKKVPEDKVDEVARVLTMVLGPSDLPKELQGLIPAEYLQEARQVAASLRAWYRGLSPVERARYAPGADLSRFERVSPELGADDPEKRLTQMVDKGDLFAYFVINEDPVKSSKGCTYVSKNLTDDELIRWFSGFATEEVRTRRLLEEQVSERVAARIQETVQFDKKSLGAGGKVEDASADKKLRQWAPVAFVYLLWVAIFTAAQMLLTNTVEEKSNRLIEVLLSSVSPLQLMAGKVLGIGVTGLTIVGSWVLCAYFGVRYGPGVLGVKMEIDLGAIVADPVFLTLFLSYFLLGYLLYAAILVGLGSVCNSLKEAQNLLQPVMILLIVPLFAMIPISQDPNGALARFLSYVPVFTPFVMMNRAAGPPTNQEYVVTSLLLLVSVAIALWAAAKIFRIGILMTGKPPRFREIIGWLRAPVGAMPVREEPKG